MYPCCVPSYSTWAVCVPRGFMAGTWQCGETHPCSWVHHKYVQPESSVLEIRSGYQQVSSSWQPWGYPGSQHIPWQNKNASSSNRCFGSCNTQLLHTGCCPADRSPLCWLSLWEEAKREGRIFMPQKMALGFTWLAKWNYF